jgi:hypothetical protein
MKTAKLLGLAIPPALLLLLLAHQIIECTAREEDDP